MTECKCIKCGHDCHCTTECECCVNDICTGCQCECCE